MSDKAIVFPGQGSQSVGMLKDLAVKYPIVLEKFTAVSDRLGFDLWQLVQTGPVDKLNQTEYTQVAVLTADVAIYTVMQQLGLHGNPKMMAGHSLGEYAALVCSEAITLEDAAALVRTRGKLMQETIPLGMGAMAAIVGLTDEQVQSLCSESCMADAVVTPANYNAIGQVVIAGNTKAVEKAIVLAEKMQARMARVIPVSVPCHCPLLNTAADHFSEVLQSTDFKLPKVAVISNVDLSVYETASQIRQLLAKQLYSPVQWVKTIQLMHTAGITEIYECGPGKVLSGLVKRIERSIQATQVEGQLLA